MSGTATIRNKFVRIRFTRISLITNKPLTIRAGNNRLSTRKDGVDGELQSIRDYAAFLWLKNKRRRQQNVVAADAVHATLRRVGQDILLQRSLTDFFGDARFFWKRLVRGFVFDELHR